MVDYLTFINDLDMSDINDIMENIPYLERNEWERTRLHAYLFGKANFKNVKKSTDMLKFPWDKEEAKVEKARKKQRKNTTTDKDIEQMKRIAERWQ